MYNKNVNGANEKSPQTATSVHDLSEIDNRYLRVWRLSVFIIETLFCQFIKADNGDGGRQGNNCGCYHYR